MGVSPTYLDGVPTCRGAGAEDGGVAKLFTGGLEPFAVLGVWVRSAYFVVYD